MLKDYDSSILINKYYYCFFMATLCMPTLHMIVNVIIIHYICCRVVSLDHRLVFVNYYLYTSIFYYHHCSHFSGDPSSDFQTVCHDTLLVCGERFTSLLRESLKTIRITKSMSQKVKIILYKT